MSTGTRINLVKGEHGWVATDEESGISSQPMPTREGALDDLDENVALATGELEMSEETIADLEATEGELERGETVSHADLKRKLGIE
ncbi:MAG TPA: hypothetical protein VKA37_05585 [Halobacteriales archaeon]|nr:hypothetical protein [Halobacteriales archaeon]